MSCKKVSHWVLRHGSEDIPLKWRDHISHCERCRSLITDIGALDTAVGAQEIPDPGEAYWEGFAPSVARRIESLEEPHPETAASRRFEWVRRWAPALGVATLALLIGHELTVDRPLPLVTDADVSVTAQPEDALKGPSESGMTTDNQNEDRGPVIERSAPSPTATKPSGNASRATGGNDSPTSTEHAETTESRSVDGGAVAGYAEDEAGIRDNTAIDAWSAPSTADHPDFTDDATQDSQVWPDRRVTTLGVVRADTPGQSTDDETRLAEQEPAALVQKSYALGTPGAETAGTFLPRQARLEAPRDATMRVGNLDSQSPTTAMRRFDELVDLRQRIGEIEALPTGSLTAEQRLQLCAMWYRLGMITSDAQLLDTAIQRLGQCLGQIEASGSDNWTLKTRQLGERRKQLGP